MSAGRVLCHCECTRGKRCPLTPNPCEAKAKAKRKRERRAARHIAVTD